MMPGGSPPPSAPEPSGTETRVLQCLQRPPESPRPLQPPERTGAAAARAATPPLQTLSGAGACVNPWVPLPGVQRWPLVPRGAPAKQHLLQLPSCALLRSAPLLSLPSLKTHSCGGCEASTRGTVVAHSRELSKPQVLLVSSQIQLQKPNADPHQCGSRPLPSSLVTGCL